MNEITEQNIDQEILALFHQLPQDERVLFLISALSQFGVGQATASSVPDSADPSTA